MLCTLPLVDWGENNYNSVSISCLTYDLIWFCYMTLNRYQKTPDTVAAKCTTWLMALAILRAYCTVSTNAASVLAQLLPLDCSLPGTSSQLLFQEWNSTYGKCTFTSLEDYPRIRCSPLYYPPEKSPRNCVYHFREASQSGNPHLFMGLFNKGYR